LLTAGLVGRHQLAVEDAVVDGEHGRNEVAEPVEATEVHGRSLGYNATGKWQRNAKNNGTSNSTKARLTRQKPRCFNSLP
jgi:hypothetical protein